MWTFDRVMLQEHFPYGQAAQLATLLWRRVTNQQVKVRALKRIRRILLYFHVLCQFVCHRRDITLFFVVP